MRKKFGPTSFTQAFQLQKFTQEPEPPTSETEVITTTVPDESPVPIPIPVPVPVPVPEPVPVEVQSCSCPRCNGRHHYGRYDDVEYYLSKLIFYLQLLIALFVVMIILLLNRS